MPKPAIVVSHWHHAAENAQLSSREFFDAIEKGVKARQADVRMERVDWNEKGVLSAKREYLRIAYGRYVFDISSFPFGRDHYLAYWHGKKPPNISLLLGCLGILALPVVLGICVIVGGPIKGGLFFLLLLAIGVAYIFSEGEMRDSELVEALAVLPYAGPIVVAVFGPTTYYSEDSRIMFEETVHRVVIDVVSGVLAINQLTPLSAEQTVAERLKRL